MQEAVSDAETAKADAETALADAETAKADAETALAGCVDIRDEIQDYLTFRALFNGGF